MILGLGLHRKPRYIRNFEEEYGKEHPFVEPVSVIDGLAVYAVGSGEPVLLFPYPHGHTVEPMAQGPIARALAEIGRMVVSFDVPGAYRSTREPVGDMGEMIRSADETLDRLGIDGPVDDPLFSKMRVPINSESTIYLGAPKRHFDAFILLPAAHRERFES
jgi:hypothetical protein